MSNISVFKNYSEYIYYTRALSTEQKEIIFKSLKEKDRKNVIKSYMDGGWADVTVRDSIDYIIDNIKEKFGYDIMDIRFKALNNKSTYLPIYIWNLLLKELNSFSYESTYFVVGGIEAVENSSYRDCVLIRSERFGENEPPEEDDWWI